MPRPASRSKLIPLIVAIVIFIILGAGTVFGYMFYQNSTQTQTRLSAQNTELQTQVDTWKQQSESTLAALEALQNEDQVKKNVELRKTITAIHDTFKQTVDTYEALLKLKEKEKTPQNLDTLFTSILTSLSQQDYTKANATLKTLQTEIAKEQQKLAAAALTAIPSNVPQNNAPPSSGYRRQNVTTEKGNFLVDIITADLNTTRVIVDTASDGTCTQDCPVLPLATYVSRSGAYAGINGSYFCPETYPSCADKKNSFDTLLMNKNKVYFNSDNNVYSTVPAAIFYGNAARFVGASQEWGRDTGVDAVIANRPLLTFGGNIAFSGGGEEKEGARGNRSFLGNTGSTGYIGVVHGATVADAAVVMKTLGIQNAINLDDGGSTALWFSGYKVGPGRNLPNVVLFVRK